MASLTQNDRDLSLLITNLKSMDLLHGSWAADKTGDFTVGELDHYGAYFITTTTAATVIGTLPSAAGNKYRTITMIKADATTGVGKVAGSALSSMGATWTALYLINLGDSLTMQSDGTVWQIKSGPISPVTGEPSWGTLHPLTTQYVAVSGADPAALWQAQIDLATGNKVPAGTKAVHVKLIFQSTLAGAYVLLNAYQSLTTPIYLEKFNEVANVNCEATGPVSVSTTRKLEWYANNASVNGVYIVILGYYI